MNISISGHHVDVTDGLRAHVEDGLAKVREHFDRVIDVDVILSVERHEQVAEFNLHANGLRIHAKSRSMDMYQSIDSAVQKLDKQVIKHKNRIQRHRPRNAREGRNYGHRIIEFGLDAPEAGAPPLTMAEQEIQGEVASAVEHRVIDRENRPLRQLTVDEAALQLDLVEDIFLVFTNADTEAVNVIYKHSDGRFGLIEPAN